MPIATYANRVLEQYGSDTPDEQVMATLIALTEYNQNVTALRKQLHIAEAMILEYKMRRKAGLCSRYETVCMNLCLTLYYD